MDLEAAWVTSEQREENRWRNIVFKTLEGVADPESCFQELYQHFAQPASWRLGAEVGPVVATLIERGIRVGLGSNYDRRLLSVLAGFHELAPLREGTVISSIIGVRKPAGGFFQEVVRVASCHRQEILFLGDDLTNDYSGALAAGLRACLLDPARRTGVTFQIERLTELISA
jgi:putative hydrolase of the HAD superfamily